METYNGKVDCLNSNGIDVSVIMLTYNHAKYISQAIESVVMQKHNLIIEILIIDDASTDGTDQILRDYKKKYPHLIKLKCNKINSGHPTLNGYQAIKSARGKYIAFLEGDDYWISLHKLQKQYDFLESHQQYSAHAGNIRVVDQNNEIIENTNFYSPQKNGTYTLNDFKTMQMPAMGGGFFSRNIFMKEDLTIIYRADKIMGDITIFMLCLLHGNIYQSTEILSAYRYICVNGGNNFNSINKENKYKEYNALRYWISLEKYVREHKYSDYRIDIIKWGIFSYGKKYSSVAMLKLFLNAKELKYLLIYFLSKYSLYYTDAVVETKCHGNKTWNEFLRDKSPLVIFGAGQMAARYIDEYAWKNDICFIVDNDLKKQNTSYKGFLIKSPDEILKQKRRCKVLIANEKYEAEIEQQLIDMGIKSYYCFCTMQSKRIINKLLRML